MHFDPRLASFDAKRDITAVVRLKLFSANSSDDIQNQRYQLEFMMRANCTGKQGIIALSYSLI